MISEKPEKLGRNTTGNESCSVCRELLANMQQFFNILETARRYSVSDWLTVDDIATELKISKSIVYRLIRHGGLEAVDIVDSNGRIPKKGHYRIKRSSLNQYLEAKRIKPLPQVPIHPSRSRRYPKVKNHLGL